MVKGRVFFMKKKFLLGAFIACSVMATAAAEEEFFFEENTVTQRLEESVITTTGFETTVRNTPKNISIITREDIEDKGAKDIGEALKGVPGINVKRLSGSDVTFDLRGQGVTAKSNVKVLLDGIPLNSIDLSGYKTSNIPIDNVERIEVIPSGGSVLYGDGAVGGIINIISKSPSSEKHYGSVGAEAGSNELFKYNASYGTALTEKLQLKLDYSDKSTDGYRDNSDDDLRTFDIATKYNFSDTDNLTFKYSRSENDFKAPGYLTREQVDEDRKQSANDSIDGQNDVDEFSIKYNIALTENLSFSLNSSYREQEYDSTTFGSWAGIPYESNYAYDTKMFYLKPQFKYDYMDDNYLIIGGDFEDSETDVTKGMSPGKREKDAYGTYFMNKYVVGSWELTQGYRYQKTEYTTPSTDETFRNDAFDLGANYLYSETGNTYISFSRAFRTPNTDELGYWDGEFNPQESDTLELGIKDFIFNSYVSASVFRTVTKDEIVFDPTANGGFGSNTNLDSKTERLGFEFSAEQYLGKLTLRESFTYLDHEIRGGEYEGNEIPGVSSILYSLGANYDFTDSLSANTLVTYHGDSYAYADFDNGQGKVSSYVTVDLQGTYDFKNGLKIYTGINNLFNKKYYDYVGYDSYSTSKTYYPAAERSFYGGFKYNF